MLRRLHVLTPLLLLLVACTSAACTSAAPPMPTTPTAIELESRARGLPDTIDLVIDVVTRGDIPALAARAVVTELECESQPGDAATLRCPDGAADGDTFEVFTSVACHAERHLADRIADAFSAFDSSGDVALYAVTEQPLGGSGLPVATHKLIFQVGDSGVALWVDRDGRIALLERACGVDLGPEVLLDDGARVLVGPLM